MHAAILCIGTELTRGEIANTNADWLAARLTALGAEVLEIATVDDEPRRMAAALRRLAESADAVLCTGGLGPTTDDLTTEVVASVLGEPLVLHEPSLEAIRQRLARHGRPVTRSNEKQAWFPQAAEVLPNPNGTAPGFLVLLGECRVAVMPGVPREMKPMFDELVAPRLASHVRGAVHQVRLRTFGLPEARVNDLLEGVESAHDVTLAYRAHFPEIEVKVLARGKDREVVRATAERAAAEVRARLGEAVFAEGDVELAAALGERLLSRGERLATAESCTGGTLSALITAQPGASAWFEGGVVAYANAVKEAMLGVPRVLLEEHGAVSESVARAMAEGARARLRVAHAISTTGVAGPGGGSPEKPVGTVYVAVASPGGTAVRRIDWPGDRRQNQLLASFAGMALLLRSLD